MELMFSHRDVPQFNMIVIALDCLYIVKYPCKSIFLYMNWESVMIKKVKVVHLKHEKLFLDCVFLYFSLLTCSKFFFLRP